jgi:chemotaxis protein methyltransferase CheR
MDAFEVEHDFLHLGRRTMLLNARMVRYEEQSSPTILIAFQDITVRRTAEREKQELLDNMEQLLAQQQTLLREMEHRIANSLQIIASILLLKAGAVASEETRYELRDAHKRVMSVAAVQSHLHSVDGIERIDISAYLNKLGAGLAASMIGPHHLIGFDVSAEDGTLRSREALSLGLIVTELVINAIKYAFPTARVGARIQVTFELDEGGWTLAVADNGIGRVVQHASLRSGGLGTAIVSALAKQLKAELHEVSTPDGLRVEVRYKAEASQLPLAA